MAELVHQTWQRITGKPWSEARAGGHTNGTAAANLALQKKLLGGWNPYGGGAAAPAAPAPAPAPVDPFQASLDKATNLFKPVVDAGRASFGAQRGRLDADFRDLETRLREDASRAGSGLEERFNQLGLLRSGQTAAGLGKVASDLTSNISRKDIERTIAQADLALKEAGFNADIGAKTLDTAKGLRMDQFTGGKLASDLLQSSSLDSIPDNVLKQILEAYGFRVVA